MILPIMSTAQQSFFFTLSHIVTKTFSFQQMTLLLSFSNKKGFTTIDSYMCFFFSSSNIQNKEKKETEPFEQTLSISHDFLQFRFSLSI
jgi:hypothetical protein